MLIHKLDGSPLLQLRQSSDTGCQRSVSWVWFHNGLEEWVQENQQTDSAPDLVGVFLGNYPLPDWISIGKDNRFVVEEGMHPVDVYGKKCTWYHLYCARHTYYPKWWLWNSPEKIPLDYTSHKVGRGLVILNKDDPDYDKYGRYNSYD
jgi:hypothetical protein